MVGGEGIDLKLVTQGRSVLAESAADHPIAGSILAVASPDDREGPSRVNRQI